MTIADQILAAVAGRETFRRAELFDAIEASENGKQHGRYCAQHRAEVRTHGVCDQWARRSAQR